MFYHRQLNLILHVSSMFQDKVLEATIAIKTSDVPAFGYVQYTLDTKDNSAKNLEKKNTLKMNLRN